MTERNPWTPSGLASITEEISHGRLGWEVIHPFPVKETTDRRAGDEAADDGAAFILFATPTAVSELEPAG